ncbi:hypothetical protein DL767_002247 [Monosporascus sp. MG133]|nr:hypothetical protein DL767_002247 [Monosporascus sp. MG133]
MAPNSQPAELLLPELHIEGRPMRTWDYEFHSPDLSSPKPVPERVASPVRLEYTLRRKLIKHAYEDVWFLQEWMIKEIFTKEAVLTELERYKSSGLMLQETNIDHIWQCISETGYYTIFALLLLLAKGHEIGNFIENEIKDSELPLAYDEDDIYSTLYRGKSPNSQPIEYFDRWETIHREIFRKYQWRLMAPYLAPGSPRLAADGSSMIAEHYSFPEQTILPWSSRKEISRSEEAQSSTRYGGYGNVYKCVIDERCHGFRELLEKQLKLKCDCFALKTLLMPKPSDGSKTQQLEAYKNEIKQLRNFNGATNPHLVTLLASFEKGRQYNFLFPYAKYSLDCYMDSEIPGKDVASVQWFARQLRGLMGGIHTIHNPKHLQNQYGRHGDIKPDNVLWYECADDPRGIFVISDMGFTACHRDVSRSNVPNHGVPRTPLYRPPECDVKGGTISRAFDIWTAGCLFLDMITWLVGGAAWRNEFSEKRTTVEYLTGARTNIYYDIMNVYTEKGESTGRHAIQVKGAVIDSQWCSEFVDDVIDIIEREMIVVLGKGIKRTYADKLEPKFAGFYDRCNKEGEGYCVVRVKQPRESKPLCPVEALLNEKAQLTIEDKKPNLSAHSGAVSKTLSAVELERLDLMS